MNNYIPYHMHTDYSLLDSCTKPIEYVNLARENGMKALSFSEHGKPLNWTEKWHMCKEAGIKYLHSVEIYLTRTTDEQIRDNYHTVLIAKNMDGVRELNRLVSMSCDSEHFYYVNRLSFEEFCNISENIIATSACLASPLNHLEESDPWFRTLLARYDFLEIQAHNHPKQIAFNQRLQKLSDTFHIPLIAGTDTHSSTKYKAECRKALLDAKQKSYGDEDAFDMTFKTYDELVDMFAKQQALSQSRYLEAIENTNQLYDMCEEIELDTSIKYPVLYGSPKADSDVFDNIVSQKFEAKLREGIIPEEQKLAFEEAIKEETRVFDKLGMKGFMLGMSELVTWCKEQGMAIGYARGSVGGSRIAYITDIIDLNPETWHTVFSRFANEDRVEIGDIDIDVTEADRPQIFAHITERFGKDKTARVASFGTIREKGVIDEVGRHLSQQWERENFVQNAQKKRENPWSLAHISDIKREFDTDPEGTKKAYPELFYYLDGLTGTIISQSVHPAGMVISPITLEDNYGVFDKDGERCLFLDMDNVHDYTGLAKYDFLILKTVQVIRDTCKYIGASYPKTHEIDWEDTEVWADMKKSPFGIFQFEKNYAHNSLKKYSPQSIFDLSVVAACIRPSGASYRDDLLAKKQHHNPSKIIDDLFEETRGYLVYQEQVIGFLQQICGLSGGMADTVRRAIGRKKKEVLDAAMPLILEGYCAKSNHPRDVSVQEVQEFMQILEDSAQYMFGKNHSIAYCLLSYLCAYYRHYYPIEFVTAFLNNAANDEDIQNGSEYASKIGIKITTPKWGISRNGYAYDKQANIIARGVASIKFLGGSSGEELYQLSQRGNYQSFSDVLKGVKNTAINSRQLSILIKIGFFSEFGEQQQLEKIVSLYCDVLKNGKAKILSRDIIDGTYLQNIVASHARATPKGYTLYSADDVLDDAEKIIKSSPCERLSTLDSALQFKEVTGYYGYVSGEAKDRTKLCILNSIPCRRKSDGKIFAYFLNTKSIGSGREGEFSISRRQYDNLQIQKGDIIQLISWQRDGAYNRLTAYDILYREPAVNNSD